MALKRLKFFLITGTLILGTLTSALAARPTYDAYQTDQAPLVDGRLDDACWQNAEVLSDFTQVLPVEGAEPSERTEARLIYTHDHLYIGIRCFDSAPDEIRATQMFRDADFHSDDYVAVVFDTFARERDGYYFSIR